MNATDDWYDVETLSEHSYRIAEGVIFNSYLVEGTDRAVLIDAGGGFGDLRGMVSQLTDLPVTLLVSHSHWDHIGAAAQFDDVLVHERELTDGRIEPASLGRGGGYGPAQFAADWRQAGRDFPDGVDIESFDIEPVGDPATVEAGDELDLGDRTLELHAIPGHSPGQLAALDRADGILYGADLVHRDHGLYIHFDGCDIHDYVDTLERVVGLRDAGAFDTLYIAHDRPLSGDGLTLLDELLVGLEAILNDEMEGEVTEDGTAREYEIADVSVLTKPDAP